MKNIDEIDRRIMLETTELLRQWQAEIKRHAAAEAKLRRKVWSIQDACPHRRLKGTECRTCGKDLAEKRSQE